jgi:hypothetical protein
LAGVGRPSKGTPKKEREYRFIGGHKKGGTDTMLECSDTMLNILYRKEEGEREERERKPTMDHIVLYCDMRYIRMDTISSLYRRERGVLAPNLTNVGQVPHIH